MSTVTATPRAGECKPEYGVTETVAFKFVEGKTFDGQFGMRVMFTLSDERKLWVDAEDGSDIERTLREGFIQRNEPVRLTKIRHARGGGHSFRIERAQGNAPAPQATAAPSREEALLEQSIAIARTQGPQAFRRDAHVMPAAPAPEAQAPAQFTHQLMGALKIAIDAAVESQAYAARKGLAVTWTSEDLRALAISCYIQAEKAASGARY